VCALGAHLVVDDYGAGHSNHGSHPRSHPKIVKLDCAFNPLSQGPDGVSSWCSTMVPLCVDLGAKVVGRIVETVEELKAVRIWCVALRAGYVLARPASPSQVSTSRSPPRRRKAPAPVLRPGRQQPCPNKTLVSTVASFRAPRLGAQISRVAKPPFEKSLQAPFEGPTPSALPNGPQFPVSV